MAKKTTKASEVKKSLSLSGEVTEVQKIAFNNERVTLKGEGFTAVIDINDPELMGVQVGDKF